jgi:hypothetical protein
VFSRLGFPQVRDVGTSGAIAVVGGLVFGGAMLVAPRSGVVTRVLDRARVLLKIAADDLLGNLYRREESQRTGAAWTPVGPASKWREAAAAWWLKRRGLVMSRSGEWTLTDRGLEAAQSLVRSHRLWESYLDQNYAISPGQLHLAADRVEHYIGPEIREAIAAELPNPQHDPHGRDIPDKPAG